MATLKGTKTVDSIWRQKLIDKHNTRSISNLIDKVGDIQSEFSDVTTNALLNKIQRVKILANRVKSPFPKAYSTSKDSVTTLYLKKPYDGNIERDLRNTFDLKEETVAPEKQELRNHASLKKPLSRDINNEIVLVNQSVSPYLSVTIQGMPREVEMNPESSWATVKSPGRNNPFYMYNGSEDTVSFDISWYARDSNREDVINKCKLLESWTKSNGYGTPPTIVIIWGSSGIFNSQNYILQSAKYILSNFQNSYRSGNRDNPNIIDLKLLPNSATQSLVFKKITENNTTNEDIIQSSKLKTTYGVK